MENASIYEAICASVREAAACDERRRRRTTMDDETICAACVVAACIVYTTIDNSNLNNYIVRDKTLAVFYTTGVVAYVSLMMKSIIVDALV